MFNLSYLFGSRAKAVAKNKEIIEAQRMQIDTTAIISIGEFIEKVMSPQREVSGPLGKFFSRYGNRIEKTLYHWPKFDHIESYNIKPQMMSESDRHIMESYSQRLTKKLPEDVRLYTEIRDDIKYHKTGIEKTKEIQEYPTLNLGMIILAIDKVSNRKDSLLYIEDKAIKSGHAQTICDFWFELDDLKDYSTFFPQRRRLNGNDKNGSDKEVWLGTGALFPGKPGLRPA